MSAMWEGFASPTVSDIAQAALRRLERSCIKAGLSVKANKTDLMIFMSKRKAWKLSITVLLKYLGVILDKALIWT